MGTKLGKVQVTLGILYDGTYVDQLEQIIDEAKKCGAKEGITNIRLDFRRIDGYYNDVSFEVTLLGDRLETEEEYTLRIKQQEIENSKDREWRRRQWEELRKEFEDA